MDRRYEREILIDYTDSLLAPGRRPTAAVPRGEQIDSLLQLANHLHAILLPTPPEARFRRRLHGDLVLAAQSRRVDEPQPGVLQQHRKGILIGAALGSIASVIGVSIAFLLRHRHGRATRIATG